MREQVDMLLMQKTMTVAQRDDDDVLFLQALILSLAFSRSIFEEKDHFTTLKTC